MSDKKQNRKQKKNKKMCFPLDKNLPIFFAIPFWVSVPVLHSVFKRAQWDALAANDESEAATVACSNLHPD